MEDAMQTNDDEMITLPKGFWREKFGADEVSLKALEKQKELYITGGEYTFSLEPLLHMPNLKEIVVHTSTIKDFELIGKVTELKKLAIVKCTFEYEKLSELRKLEKFKELILRRIPVSDISYLAEMKSFKSLTLSDMDTLDISQLKQFSKLQQLCIRDMNLDNLDFLQDCKALKELSFDNVPLRNLDFLQYLKKLKKFEYAKKVEDESGLRFLKDLTQLKEFMYPVSDMEYYAGCEKLEEIGVDAVGLSNVEMLENSGISSVTICNAKDRKQADDAIDVFKKMLDLRSYGMRGNFLKK